jgi:hypothetical protein
MAMKFKHVHFTRVLSAATVAVALAALSSPPVGIQAQGDANQIVPMNAYKDLKWRMVGASRGGRVTAFAGVRQQPHTFYHGATGGGVWKTEDAGITWTSIGDGQIATGSIGSIDVAPSNPNHVWVGTGSAAIRSNVIIGRGVYKSTDAGKTFQFMGLRESGQIGGLRVHPTNPDVVWLAATSKWTGKTPTCSTRRSIAASARAGTSSAAGLPIRAGSTSPLTAAKHGSTSRLACRSR